MEIKPTPHTGDGPPLYYNHYREFWQRNLQTLEEMARDLEKNLSVLERKYLDFDTVYDEISRQIDILSSIYSSYNSLLGQEYLLKLKALMRNYRARYSVEGVNFNLIHFLQMKVRENLERSFEEYPRMEHREEKRATRTPAPAKKTHRPAPSHQWHTFQRNGSWFIVPCAESLVYPFSDAPIEGDGDPKRFNLAMAKGGTVPIQDLFAPTAAGTARIHYVLLIRGPNGTGAFAADRAGRKIMAGRDFITPLLKGGGIKPAKGSVRLFGRRHYFIEPTALSNPPRPPVPENRGT